MGYTITEKLNMFLKVYKIELPMEGCEIGYLHTYSVWTEFKNWCNARRFNACNHHRFLLLLDEIGFKFTQEMEIRAIINKDKHQVAANTILYKPRFDADKKTEWFQNALK